MKRFAQILLQTYVHTTADERWSGCPEGVAWQPLLDIYERPDAITIVAELPGVDEAHIRVGVSGNRLQITGFRQKEIPGDTLRVHQMEIAYGPFGRSVELPRDSDIDRIEAEHRQGYLTVTIPRKARR